MNDTVDRGGIVLSSAGHDKGKFFFVIGTDGDNYLLLADGKFRPIEKPKKKKKYQQSKGRTKKKKTFRGPEAFPKVIA